LSERISFVKIFSKGGEDLNNQKEWALILGASSGFGAATSLELSRRGFNIFGVHLDRRETLPKVEELISRIKRLGREAVYFNINAADPEKRRTTLDVIETKIKKEEGNLRILVHSLAFGTLLPYIAESQKERVSKPQMEMTLDVMAHTLVYWVQEIIERRLMKEGGRIFALTSAGSKRVWKNYGPVSAAKASLEAHVRQLAVELAPFGVTVNALRPGVTDTPALRKIPGHEEMLREAKKRNPMGRLTTPEDVAKAIALLSHPDSQWITGNIIGVDGGETIVA